MTAPSTLSPKRRLIRMHRCALFAVAAVGCAMNAHGLRHGDHEHGRRLNEQHKPGGAAIAILLPHFKADVENCCIALKSLRFLRGDAELPAKQKAPVLLFNEGDLRDDQLDYLKTCTDRTLAFPIVKLNAEYPKGFGEETTEWRQFLQRYGLKSLGRPPYFSYANMIAFWTRWIWEHPAVQQFDTVMRIDTDSCFLDTIDDNPSLQNLPYLDEQYVYHSIARNQGMSRHFYNTDTGMWFGQQHRPDIANLDANFDCAKRNRDDYVVGLHEYVTDYVQRENITPVNEGIWSAMDAGWSQFCSMMTFQTNFEVVRREFFQDPVVTRWHRALVGATPFGTYRYRWGDAQTRFLTMGMFAPEGSVLTSNLTGYAHGKDYDMTPRKYWCEMANDEGMFNKAVRRQRRLGTTAWRRDP